MLQLGALRKLLGLHVDQPQQQHISGVGHAQTPQPQGQYQQTPNGDTLKVAPHWQPHQNLGATDVQVQGNYDVQAPQPTYLPIYGQPVQGGQHNPGLIPLQDNNPVRYRQGFQPTQSWYDF